MDKQKINNQRFRILALDGGGMRGILPASYLTYIESKVDNPLYRYFDMIVGASTGGIIACALACNIPAQTVLSFYLDRGKVIFRKPRWIIWNSKYRIEDLEVEVKKIFGEKTKIGDALCRLCIPTIDIINGKNVVYKTRHHLDYIHDYNLPIWQAVVATAAAPIYFAPFSPTGTGRYVDGGLWGNNPSLIGISEAIKLGYTLDQIEILSIGTGSKIFYKNRMSRSGLLGWKTSLIDLVFQSISQASNNTSTYLCGSRYRRIDFLIPDALDAELDNIKNVTEIQEIAIYRAKETFSSIRDAFFMEIVESFFSIPT